MKKEKKRMSNFQDVLYRFSKNKVSLIGVAILVVLLLVIIFAEQISPYQYGIKNNVSERLQGPSAKHWFGTDGYGRDIFTRVIHGAKFTMIIALPATLFAQAFGAILGALAAFYTKYVDGILMRILDVFQAIPGTLLALAVVAALGTSLPNLVIAMMISRIPGAARSARARSGCIFRQKKVYYRKLTKGGRFLCKNWKSSFIFTARPAMWAVTASFPVTRAGARL